MATNKMTGGSSGYDRDGNASDEGSRLSEVANSARDAAESAREKISDLGSTATTRVDGSPLIAVGAGVALGAVLAAVLPTSQREKELLAPIGGKITAAGNGAVDRARDLGKQKFDEMAGDKVREFFGSGSSSSNS